MSLSISQKLAATVTAAVATAGLLTGAVSVQQEYSRYVSSNNDALLASASAFSALVSKPVATGDIDKIFDVLSGIGGIRAPDGKNLFLQAVVWDRDGKVLSRAGYSARLDDDAVVTEGGTHSVFDLLKSHSIAVVVPVIDGGTTVGRLELVKDASDLLDRLIGSIELTLIGTALAFCVGLGVAMPLNRGIVSPLKRLQQAMVQVREKHDYSVTLPARGGDEIGVLVSGYNAMLSDIRERDASLLQHRDRLEHDVAERTRDLAIARDEAERANAAKSDFLATMSHEIRTPMSGMLVMAELLASGDLPPRSRRYAQVITQSGAALLAIINDILDFAKIEAGKMDLETVPVDLERIIVTALNLFYARAREKGIDLAARIDPAVPASIIGDPVRLQQIVSNLLGNAIKFTAKGSVKIEIERITETRSRIAVRDTGVGIPPDKLSAIFEAFDQADQSTTRKFGGTGLGLAISSRLADAMGSRILVESQLGSGSLFYFDVAHPEPTPAREWPKLPARDKPTVAVVIVEGEQTASGLLADLAYCGFDAHASQHLPDPDHPVCLLVADASALLALPSRPSADYVIAIAEPDEEAEAKLEAIADLTLTRPIIPADVRNAVRQIAAGEPLRTQTEAIRSKALPSYPNARVLAADDTIVNREVLSEALGRFGIKPVLVSNGAEALEAMADQPFDLVLMDGSMPVLDGFEACRQRRVAEARLALPRTPIVALTAHVVGSGSTAWRDAGMDDIVHKPFTLADIDRCLARWLSAESAVTVEPSPARPVETGGSLPLLNETVLNDIARTSEATGGSFADRVFRLYRDHAPSTLQELSSSRDSGDLPGIAAAAHALKSMSFNIGAVRVASLANEIEQSARAGLWNASDIAALETTLAETIAILPRSRHIPGQDAPARNSA